MERRLLHRRRRRLGLHDLAADRPRPLGRHRRDRDAVDPGRAARASSGLVEPRHELPPRSVARSTRSPTASTASRSWPTTRPASSRAAARSG
ncbi:MAG: hypothetical protein MZW92_33565 [Comamonadaceae bacterium]|nr:hypothetical protein [Comamonadaceae bacterium]